MKNIARISMLLAAAFCSAARRREVRPAGAREPASPTSVDSGRPDARTGRARARRLSLLLPVLALLLGALGLFAPAPAEATHSLATPTNLQAQAGDAQVTLTWSGITNHRGGYTVAYGEHPSGTLSTQNVAVTANRTVTITGLTNNTTYRFRVQARPHSGHTASAWTSFVTATPSAPSSTAVWSATLTVKQLPTGFGFGCLNAATAAAQKCSTAATLSDDDFPGGDGNTRSIVGIQVFSSGNSRLTLNSGLTTTHRALNFCVGSTALALSGATSGTINWSSTGLTWSAGDEVSLSIQSSCGQGSTPTLSTNADLSALTAGSSTSSGGQYTNFSIGTFGATTTTYTASVANDQTHVKLTPTVADTGKASVGVRKGQGSFTPVTSGSASSAIALDVGANTLVVRVTAEDTTTTKDYTVTVTRRAAVQTLSTNADLSGLTAGSATSSGGQYTDFSIGTFGASTTTYTATVANDRTHVKLTPTVADTGKATVGVRKGTSGNFTAVTSGSASSAIALGVGVNAITVRVTAEDTTTTKDYTVTVTRQALPAKVTTAVSGTMTVGDGGKWKGFRAAPTVGALSDADFTYGGVDYRILGLRLTNIGGFLLFHLDKALDRKWGLVLNVGDSRFRIADAVLSTGPGYEGVIASWAYSNQGETPPSWTVGQSVPVSLGTLTSSTVKLSVSPNPVNEGASASVEACLSAVPQGTVRIPVTLSHGTSEDGDWGVSLSGDTDGRLPISTAYTIAISGWLQTSCGVVNIPTHPDSDLDDETFTVALDTTSLPPGVRAGRPASVQVRIKDLTDLPEVTLRAVRRTVAEGSPVELQVALTKPLANDVEIPLRVRWVTSETADHGFVRSITIAAGATSGTCTIRTHEDDDTDDERFQVAVIQPDLPPGVAPGSPSTVGIVIVDAANARLRALDLNSGN